MAAVNMFDFVPAGLIHSLVADPRFPFAVAITALSGLVRGFSGFGSALIYIPLIAAIYEPRIAALTLLITDFVASAPLTFAQARKCNWREVAPMTVAAALTVPFGALALQFLDPIILRWGIAGLVTMLVVVLMSGWRHNITPGIPASACVGLAAGFGAGATQIAAPLPIIYWLGGPSSAALVRANLMVFLLLLESVSIMVYAARGLFAADILMLSVLLGPVFIVSIAIGARLFKGAAELTYRRVAYAIVALSALVSLPLFDGLFR